jgi:hypothetical protein
MTPTPGAIKTAGADDGKTVGLLLVVVDAVYWGLQSKLASEGE